MTWQELIFYCIPIVGLLIICIIALFHKDIYSKSKSNTIKSKPYFWFEYKEPKEKIK